MKLEELKAGLTEHKDSEDLKAVLAGLVPVTTDSIQAAISKDATLAKRFTEVFVDKPVNDAVIKNEAKVISEKLPGLVDARVKELNPEMTVDQKRIAVLELENKDRDAKLLKAELKVLAGAKAVELKLPTALADHLIGDDADSTLANMQAVADLYETTITEGVEARFKEGGREPETRQKTTLSSDDLSKLSPEAKLKWYNEHPEKE